MLLVKEGQEAPQFLTVPEPLSTLKGSDITLTCEAHGKPMPKITWKKDDKTVKSGKHVKVETMEKEDKLLVVSELQLYQVEPLSSDGMYSVTATNKAGAVTHVVEVNGEST